MSHRIPPEIINQVLHLSLGPGLSVRPIARKVGISVGSVQSMLQEFARNDTNYHLMRTLAINLHKNGTDVLEYGWLVRLRNILQNAGASLTAVEEIITKIPMYCYKAGIDIESLVEQLKLLIDYRKVNPGDPLQCNLFIESYDKRIQRNEMGGAHMNETYSEAKFKDMLESLLTDDKIQELNEGCLYPYTKQEIAERIMEVIENPACYENLFFEPEPIKIASSAFQT